jgi:hypothetical protein
MTCRCKVRLTSDQNSRAEIKPADEILHCPLHSAAPLLVEALKECERYIWSLPRMEETDNRRDAILRKCRELIAAVM